MDELKNLKRAMKKHTFQQLEFTDQLQSSIQQKLTTNIEQELFLLLHEQKTATQLIQLLQVKGITAIQQNEGVIFSTLHEAEIKDELKGFWNEFGEKSYVLTKKGKKKYAISEKSQVNVSLKKLFTEVTAHGH